ncbi:DUF6482 family protein [Echinimonas agarilytica]|uniref:DUF6482 family protein n=1 Tax=Echinimonas agarilytica TaxID=1215918 RepID=A0AA41W5S6_9GAMM|nr:DUF6482 family protein [Echinimonas agarilytica]MCM2679048.1 DUF6482 family protein [Echinimonas agarilytica]
MSYCIANPDEFPSVIERASLMSQEGYYIVSLLVDGVPRTIVGADRRPFHFRSIDQVKALLSEASIDYAELTFNCSYDEMIGAAESLSPVSMPLHGFIQSKEK